MTTAISPIPDLLPLEFDQAYVDRLEAGICRNCRTPRRRASSRIMACRPMTPACSSPTRRPPTIYEAAVAHGGVKRDPKLVANWITGDVAAFANSVGLIDAADPYQAGPGRGPRRSDQRRHDLRQDREGRAGDHRRRGRRTATRARSSRRAG